MAKYINADSLAFISVDGMYRALGEQGRVAGRPSHCDACFTGDYPTSLTDHDEVDQLALIKEAVPAE
jgi:amidophosphoribosyltransferase